LESSRCGHAHEAIGVESQGCIRHRAREQVDRPPQIDFPAKTPAHLLKEALTGNDQRLVMRELDDDARPNRAQFELFGDSEARRSRADAIIVRRQIGDRGIRLELTQFPLEHRDLRPQCPSALADPGTPTENPIAKSCRLPPPGCEDWVNGYWV